MRLGWLIEKNQQKWSVNEPVLKKLEKKRPESRILLIKKKPRGNYLVRRWSLMVPKTLNERGEIGSPSVLLSPFSPGILMQTSCLSALATV